MLLLIIMQKLSTHISIYYDHSFKNRLGPTDQISPYGEPVDMLVRAIYQIGHVIKLVQTSKTC
jgi:hypothetical protein